MKRRGGKLENFAALDGRHGWAGSVDQDAGLHLARRHGRRARPPNLRDLP